MNNNVEISIIIPAYNEEKRIRPTLLAIVSYMRQSGRSYELIVADDGSKDGTVALLHSLNIPELRVLETERNGGKGSAVRRGMIAAQGELILFADADNATPIEELDNLLRYIEEDGHDMAIGSRGVHGATVENKGMLRHACSYGLNQLVQVTLRLPYHDTQCGFKLFTRQAAQRICQAQTLMGFSFDLEILYLARKYGYSVAEVPVFWRDVAGSTVNPVREVRRFLRDIFTIRITDWQGGYAHVG